MFKMSRFVGAVLFVCILGVAATAFAHTMMEAMMAKMAAQTAESAMHTKQSLMNGYKSQADDAKDDAVALYLQCRGIGYTDIELAEGLEHVATGDASYSDGLASEAVATAKHDDGTDFRTAGDIFYAASNWDSAYTQYVCAKLDFDSAYALYEVAGAEYVTEGATSAKYQYYYASDFYSSLLE